MLQQAAPSLVGYEKVPYILGTREGGKTMRRREGRVVWISRGVVGIFNGLWMSAILWAGIIYACSIIIGR